MINSKKSQWLMYGLIAGLVGAIIVMIVYSAGKNEFNIIGDSSLAMLGASKTAEKALLYIDQSAKYSLQQAAYDLAKSGGISEERDIVLGEPFVPYECGRYYGSYVWLEIKKDKGADLEKDCFDESLARPNLEYGFDNKLNKFLANYLEIIPTSNYDYEFKGNLEVLGIAKEPIKINLYGKDTSSLSKKEDNVKIGEYSIKPSFKAKIDYNIDEEYSSLKTQLMAITKECKPKDMEKCLKEKSRELEWECAESDKDILYDFIYKLNDCFNSNTDDTLCTFSLDKRDYLNNVKPERNFEIKLSNSLGRVKANMFEERKLVATDYINIGKLAYTASKENEGTDADSVTIKIKYSDGNAAIEDAYASTKESAKLDLSMNFYIYKKNGVISFIDRSIEGLFRPEVVNSIEIPLTKGVNFCANTGKQLYAYDSSDNTVKLREIIYNFAVAFPKPPPPPIQKLEVFDALKAENSAILVWENIEDEAGSYAIYYSDKDFADIKMEEISKDTDIKKINVDIKNEIEIEDIDLKNCAIDEIGSPCKYGIYDKPLQPNKLYYHKSKNKHFFVIANILDGKEHNFAVVAANNAGQLDNDKSIEGNIYVLTLDKNYFRFAPVDDLAPGKVTELGIANNLGKLYLNWNKPLVNIDGSSATDVAGFDIYYIKSTSDLLPQLEPGHKVKRITTADANCGSVVALACEYDISNLNLEKSLNYNVAAVALDENNNDYKTESDKINVVIA